MSSQGVETSLVPAWQRDWRVDTAAWCGPRWDAPTEMFAFAREPLGITILLPACCWGGGFLRQSVWQSCRALDKAAEAGVQLLLWDPRLLDDISVVHEYPSHPALAGFVLTDEPHASLFPQLNAARWGLRERRPELLAYVNLPASWTEPSMLGRDTYEQYLDEFAFMVAPDVWSFDDYGTGQGHDLQDALQTLAMVKARAGDKPVWGYVSTVSFDERPVPSFEQKCEWAAAFRARDVAVAWFSYYRPPGGDGIAWQGGYAEY